MEAPGIFFPGSQCPQFLPGILGIQITERDKGINRDPKKGCDCWALFYLFHLLKFSLLFFLSPLKFTLKLNLVDDGELVIHRSLAKEHSPFQIYAFRSLILMSTGAPQLD